MKDLIQTPYGVVRLGTLQALQSSFDTTMLLKTVEDLDEFWVQWKQELRDDILRVHAMAHTLIKVAPLSHPPGNEPLAEMAGTHVSWHGADNKWRSIASIAAYAGVFLWHDSK